MKYKLPLLFNLDMTDGKLPASMDYEVHWYIWEIVR